MPDIFPGHSNSQMPSGRLHFYARLCWFFTSDIAGHSLRVGGATALAEHGVSPSIIQAADHWHQMPFSFIYVKTPLYFNFFKVSFIPFVIQLPLNFFLLSLSFSFLFSPSSQTSSFHLLSYSLHLIISLKLLLLLSYLGCAYIPSLPFSSTQKKFVSCSTCLRNTTFLEAQLADQLLSPPDAITITTSP